MGSLPEKVIENWWNVNSRNMRESGPANDGEGDVSYGMFMPPERKLKLLGELTGRSVIDLGCGAGDNSVLLAKRGATVTGLDISSAQLEIAKTLTLRERVKLDFVRTSIWDLSSFRSESYDVAFSVWALQFVKDLGSCFIEVCRVLRPGGMFVFSIAHPFYSVVDPATQKVVRPYTQQEMETLDTWNGETVKLIVYRPRVSEVCNSLAGAGLCIERVVEDIDLTSYDAHIAMEAWRREWAEAYPAVLLKMIPTCIAFRARKPAHQ